LTTFTDLPYEPNLQLVPEYERTPAPSECINVRESKSIFGIASDLPRMLSSKHSHGVGRRDLSLWGNGIVDQSLTTLWYPRHWNEVSEDELVLLIPTLASPHHDHAKTRPYGPSFFLRKALCARLRWATLALTPVAADGAAPAPSQLLEIMAETGVVTTLPTHQGWIEGEKAFLERYASVPMVRPTACCLSGVREPTAYIGREAWIFELSILKCLDRLLQDSLRTTEIAQEHNSVELPFRLVDVLIATTYASFNGAYIYPQFTIFHELFTVGAWLGYLLRGRAALMPTFIAEYILDRLVREPMHSDSDLAECDRLLRFHINLVAGMERLVMIARQVNASGRSAVVNPTSHAPECAGASRYVWNEALWRHIAARLNLGTTCS
jgi:hypothetical protein